MKMTPNGLSSKIILYKEWTKEIRQQLMPLRAGALAIFSLDKSWEGQAYLFSAAHWGFKKGPSLV